MEYGGREYDRGREYESYGRAPYQSRDPYQIRYEGVGFSVSRRGARVNVILVRFSDTDFDLPDQDDIRRRTVFDEHGNDLGDVDDLIIDPQQRRLRFLVVTTGGFLGFGGKMMLIPVEAITRVTNKVVAIDQRGTGGFAGEAYNPRLIDTRSERYEYDRYDRGYWLWLWLLGRWPAQGEGAARLPPVR